MLAPYYVCQTCPDKLIASNGSIMPGGLAHKALMVILASSRTYSSVKQGLYEIGRWQ